MTNLSSLKVPQVGYYKSNLQKDGVLSDFKAESDGGSCNNAIVLDAYASDKSINYKFKRDKLMKGYILFRFTDESTLAAPNGVQKINFDESLAAVVKYLDLKLQNMFVVKLHKPIMEKDILCWLMQFRKELLKIGVMAHAAYPVADYQDAPISKCRLHADDTVDTIRYAMPIFLYK